MNIYLVRHTEYHNPDNIYLFHLPLHLSSKGKEQAINIGEWFKNNALLQFPIYSSPIKRCEQTAKIIASEIKSKVYLDDRLIETTCPNLQGKVRPNKRPWKVEADESSRESKKSILIRILSIFSEKVKEGKDCILVTHGDPATVLYYHLKNNELPKYLWNPKNSKNAVDKGEIVKISLKNNKVVRVKKIVYLE